MRKLNVPDMHCQHCVKRIKDALDTAGISSEIDLAEKTVAVSEDKVKKTISILDDLGFDAN